MANVILVQYINIGNINRACQITIWIENTGRFTLCYRRTSNRTIVPTIVTKVRFEHL